MVNHKKDVNRKLLIIGNGFDMAHSLPTSYENFKIYLSNLIREDEGLDKSEKCLRLKEIPKSTIPKIHTGDGIIADFEQERKIIYWLIDDVAKRKHNIDWRKFENYLGQLRFNKVINKWGDDKIDKQCLSDCISDIKGFFFEWINTIDLGVARTKEPYSSIINEKGDMALSFNYTETLEYVYGMDALNICYIHGQRETDAALQMEKSMSPFGKNNSHLVVGFGSKYVRNRRDVLKKSLLMRLYKDTKSIIYQHNEFFNKIACSGINEIYSLGFSFSEADMPYIKRICDVFRCDDNDIEMTWVIAPYGKLFKRVREEVHFRKSIRQAGFRGKICIFGLNT